MADVLKFYSDLVNQQKALEASQNPWLMGGNALTKGIETLNTSDRIKAGADYNPWKDVLAQALAGFGGGLMQGAGTAQLQQGMTDFGSQLAQALASPNTVEAFKANSALAPYTSQAGLYAAQEQADQLKEVRDFMVRKELIKYEKDLQDAAARASEGKDVAATYLLLGQEAPALGGTPPAEGAPGRTMGLVQGPAAAQPPISPASSAKGKRFPGLVQDPIHRKYLETVAINRASGMPDQQAKTAASEVMGPLKKSQEAIEEQAKLIDEKATQLIRQGQEILVNAQQVGDQYINIKGKLNRKIQGWIDENDPVYVAAKNLDTISRQMLGVLKSDSQISQREVDALMQAGPSGSNPYSYNLGRARAAEQFGMLYQMQAEWYRSGRSMGLMPEETRAAWNKAYNATALVGVDPETGVPTARPASEWVPELQRELQKAVAGESGAAAPARGAAGAGLPDLSSLSPADRAAVEAAVARKLSGGR